jgi:hypothetical protein
MLKYEGGFRVLSQQSESADNRPDLAGQNGAIVDQAARLFSVGERPGAETPATGDKATSGERKHWLDYATAFLTLAAAGGAITAAVFTGWQATTADQGLSTRRISASFITGPRTRAATRNGLFLR